MPIPESQRENNDLVDLLTTSFQKVTEIKDQQGEVSRVLEIDPKIAWWGLHSIASNTVGRFAKELETFENRGVQAKKHMCKERAASYAEDIYGLVDAYRYSMDAKNSETLSDKNNAVPNLIDKIKSNRVERRYVLKDQAAKSMWSGIVGKDREKDQDAD